MIDLGGFEISFSQRNVMVAVLIIYSLIIVGIGFYVKWASKKNKDNKFASYMTGGGNLNGFQLGMIVVTGALAGGTMVGAPGLCYSIGLAAILPVYAGFAQAFGNMAITGRKTAIVAHRINATSPVNLLRHRYQSRTLAWILAICVVVFGATQASSNLMIAARLFTAITGASSYFYGLALAVIAILVYTLSGGVKSLAKVAVIQGVLMTVTVLVLAFRQYGTVYDMYGSVEAAIRSVETSSPALVNFNNFTPLYVYGQIMTYAHCCFALPVIMQGSFTYNKVSALKRAIIIGMIVTSVLFFLLTGGSLLTRAINPNLAQPEYSIVYLATSLLPSPIAGLVVCACFAAVQSTVATLLLVGAGGVVRDLIKTDIKRDMDDKEMNRWNLIITLIMAAVAIIIGLKPTPLTQYLNLFSTAGMMVTYLWPFFLGLYWKGATRAGAIAASAGGFISYLIFTLISQRLPEFWQGIGNPHCIVPGMIVSLILMIVVSKMTKKVPLGVAEVWFSPDYDESYAEKFS